MKGAQLRNLPEDAVRRAHARWRAGEISIAAAARGIGCHHSTLKDRWQALGLDAPATEAKPPYQPPLRAPIERGRRGWSDAEIACIEAAEAAGKVKRIEAGAWPSVFRPDVAAWKRTPQQKKRRQA